MEYKKFKDIDLEDEFFDTLKEDYPVNIQFPSSFQT